jgi:hypothetical protein
MMTFNYSVIAHYENCVLTLQTVSAEQAIAFLFEHTEAGAEVDILDNYTGEVLVSNSLTNTYITEEWTLMILGWMTQNAWSLE